jgi:hypothetical protein
MCPGGFRTEQKQRRCRQVVLGQVARIETGFGLFITLGLLWVLSTKRSRAFRPSDQFSVPLASPTPLGKLDKIALRSSGIVRSED